MHVPNDTVLAFPGIKDAGLRWQALSLANAARAAAEALALSHDLGLKLNDCAARSRTIAADVPNCLRPMEIEAKAGMCQALGRQIAAL